MPVILRSCSSVLLFLFILQTSPAQPVLDFRRIDVNYPTITLSFKVTCNGTTRVDMGPQHFEVYENGLLMKDATIWCPPEGDCCVSVALVLDRTGSMAGTKLTKVKAGANAFVNQMNPDGQPCDEASIITLSTRVYRDVVPLTTNKALLTSVINGMIATGNTPLWDAIAVGILEGLSGAKNRCKAVIVLTDGGDNNSQTYRSVQEVIALAQINNVKVYTIGYGVQVDSKPEYDLKALAGYTGGVYYFSETGDDLAQIYASIKKTIQEGYKECYISYTAGCPDGSLRAVDLMLKNYCGGSATQTKTYRAPLNTAQFQNVRLVLGSATVNATNDVVIPVLLETPVKGVFSRGNFTVIYNRSAAQMVGVSTEGGLLNGTPVNMLDIGSGHTIYVQKHTEINGSGPLLFLHFKTADVLTKLETILWLYNWHFEAYCLIPNFQNGLLTILPREPKLECESSIPASLQWNDNVKDYEPNPFTVSTTVRNTGLREARNVRVKITVTQPGLELVSPTVETQYVQGATVYPGQEKTVQWDLLALKQENASTMRVCFTITADLHPPIECCRDILIGEAQSPSLVCSLAAPDTIFFREQYYEPEEFDIDMTVHNAGSGLAKDIRGQLLQDTRFTILSPASLELAGTLLPGATVSGRYRVRMHPRSTDGYDTVRVNVQGTDTDPAWCELPIFVQRERAPKFVLSCTTPTPELTFNEIINDYEPNPFVVTTIAKNIGETYAEECQIMFVGPPRFTPLETNLRHVGTMQVNDERSERWMIRALPRETGGWDTLVFQVQGKGGLGRRIVIAECRLPVYVPPVRRPAYVVRCALPDSLQYQANRYLPDPFTYSMTVSNTGTAAGHALAATLVLPSGVVFAPGEISTKFIADLNPGDSATVNWSLSPVPRTDGAVMQLCGRMLDGTGLSVECCRTIYIPRMDNPLLQLSCSTIDTLHIDTMTGQYLGNPFNVRLTITNAGRGTAENVLASINLLGPAVKVLDPPNRLVGDIPPGDMRVVTWSVQSLTRTEPASIPVKMRVSADNHAEALCERSVFIPAMQWPVLEAACSSEPEDTLHFDWSVGDFEPTEFTVTLRVRNNGMVRANNATALLVVPSGVTLVRGETTQKVLTPPDIEPGMEAVAAWKLKPVREREGADREFRFFIQADNTGNVKCEDHLFVQGSPKSNVLSIPGNTVFRYGEKGFVPVTIDRTIGKSLASYSFELVYDPSVVTVRYVSNVGTLTQLGWVGASMASIASNRVRISDYTTSSPLRADSGALVMLYVEGVYRDADNPVSFGYSPFHFDETKTQLNLGEISVTTRDGGIYVTTDCLEPLKSSSSAVLEQNRPNPFNPSTAIRFLLGSEQYVRLVVHDRMGREVRVMLAGVLKEGEHLVRFDGGGLPSGMYFYRLETATGTIARKMLLAR